MCGPHQVWPLRSECWGRGVPTKVVCAECMKMCCLGGKNSVVKGLTEGISVVIRSVTSLASALYRTTANSFGLRGGDEHKYLVREHAVRSQLLSAMAVSTIQRTQLEECVRRH